MDFDDYLNYLYFKDIYQDKIIYEQLENDKTIIDTDRRDEELKKLLLRFENLINTRFPSYSVNIDQNNLQATIFIIIKLIYNFYDKDREKYPRENKFVADMLFQNKAWKTATGGTPYEKSYTIYSTLCHSTHNTLSSVEDRTINNGYFMLNNQPSQIEAILSLAYYCAVDTLEDLKIILR